MRKICYVLLSYEHTYLSNVKVLLGSNFIAIIYKTERNHPLLNTCVCPCLFSVLYFFVFCHFSLLFILCRRMFYVKKKLIFLFLISSTSYRRHLFQSPKNMTQILSAQNTLHRRKTTIDNADGLHVIGVGLPRTGTSSLQAALEILGFAPCHHMTELLKKPVQSKTFARILDGDEVDFHELLKGYRSSVDVPTVLFYKELHQIYPKAKLVLTIRDSDEEWYECFKNSISTIWLDNFFFIIIYPIRNLRLLCIVARKIAQRWINEYGTIGPHIHQLHNARVIQENKPSELLVFNVKEGWTPLCQFLNVPCPQDIPFPNGNYPEYIQSRLLRARLLGFCTWILIASGLVILIYFLVSFMYL